MFFIKDRGIKALENNLKAVRKELKNLKKDNQKLALENESLKIENMHYKHSAQSYEKKYIKTKEKLKEYEERDFQKVLENMSKELDETIEECRNGKKTERVC